MSSTSSSPSPASSPLPSSSTSSSPFISFSTGLESKSSASSSPRSPLVIPTHLANFINGEFLPPTTSQYLNNFNPSTNQILCQIPRSDHNDVELAVKAARAAFPSWSALPFSTRQKYLKSLSEILHSQLHEFARIESLDTGKPITLATNMDIPRAIGNFDFFSSALTHDEVGCHHMDEAVNFTQRSPIGVGGLITPWNLPIYLLSWKIAPALLMGNTIIAKPSEITPMTAYFLCHVMNEAKLPPGVFNVVHGYGGEVGQPMLQHKDIPFISFTGGTETGKRVATTCAPLFKKTSLELGGKNATIVFDDADMEITVQGVVRASFANQGQICLCGSRLLIQQGGYDKFMALLLKEIQKLVPGDPSLPTTNYGSLSSLQHRDKIESYVKIAVQDGGKVLCGGKRPSPSSLPPHCADGAYYEPTLIGGLPSTHQCSQEEIFGPVVMVHTFNTVEEAITMANNTKYGLAGSVWTTNLNVAHRVSREWQTGMVWVNCIVHRDLRVPFGGIKESGLGTEGGKHSLEFYSNTKNICIHYGNKK